MQESQVMIDLRRALQRNGDVYFLRFGHCGGGGIPSDGCDRCAGEGSSVSKVR